MGRARPAEARAAHVHAARSAVGDRNARTFARDVTEHARPPRAVFLPFMMGRQFGVPFHRALQQRIVLACLDHLVLARASGEICTRPVAWAEPRKEGAAIERELGLRR